MDTKNYIIKNTTRKEKRTLIWWGIFYPSKLNKVIEKLKLGMNINDAIKDVKNTW